MPAQVKHTYRSPANNVASSYESVEDAKAKSILMDAAGNKGCRDCTDCVACTDCVGCRQCTRCEDCSFCTGVTDLQGSRFIIV